MLICVKRRPGTPLEGEANVAFWEARPTATGRYAKLSIAAPMRRIATRMAGTWLRSDAYHRCTNTAIFEWAKTLCVLLPRGKANVALFPRGAMKMRSQSLSRAVWMMASAGKSFIASTTS